MAAQLFRTRRALMDVEEDENLLTEEDADWSRYWHKSFQLSDQTVTICQRCRQFRLNKTEREVVVALVLDQLAMLKSRIQTNADLLGLVVRPGRKAIDVARTLSEHGKLFLVGLMTFDDPDEEPAARRPIVDPVLVDAVLASRTSAEPGWGAANESELMDRLQALTQVLMQKSDTMQHLLQGWEVRDVNVLLQELERFEGICILATNRKITLDKALERRITLKVEFERPDRKQRREIWAKFLPHKLPLERDVELDELSVWELAGGEIKNVVLNAARIAVKRDECGPVTMQDFREAVAMEYMGRWNRNHQGRIGFQQ